MKRALYFLLISTLIFHVVHTTWEINVLHEEITSIRTVLARIERQAKQVGGNLKRDAGAGLDTMDKTFPEPLPVRILSLKAD